MSIPEPFASLLAYRIDIPGFADLDLVGGETDSERLFALITREARRHDGDVHAGIAAAVGWAAEQLPVYLLNLILTTELEVFAGVPT